MAECLGSRYRNDTERSADINMRVYASVCILFILLATCIPDRCFAKQNQRFESDWFVVDVPVDFVVRKNPAHPAMDFSVFEISHKGKIKAIIYVGNHPQFTQSEACESGYEDSGMLRQVRYSGEKIVAIDVLGKLVGFPSYVHGAAINEGAVEIEESTKSILKSLTVPSARMDALVCPKKPQSHQSSL